MTLHTPQLLSTAADDALATANVVAVSAITALEIAILHRPAAADRERSIEHLRGRMKILGDIVSPIDDVEYDALK